MEKKKFIYDLCGKKCCPVVTITENNTVEIGENNNLVKLKKNEWNKLVDGIKNGQLKKIK